MGRILGLLKTNTTAFPSDLVDTIATAGGAPVQIWSNDASFVAIIAEGDASVQSAMAAHAAVACATTETILAPDNLDIDPGASELAGAWNTYVGNDYQTNVGGFYSQSIMIDRMFPPGGCAQGAGDDGGGSNGSLVASAGPLGTSGGAAFLASPMPGGGTATATAPATVVHKDRRALVGTIGVAVAYVGGPAGSTAELTPADNANLGLALMHAFDVYYDLAPKAAHLVFACNVRRTTLTLDPTTVPVPATPAAPAAADYEAAEAPWRDAALAAFGQSAGWNGIDAFIASATFGETPDYTHAAFLTKYPTAWMAYCSSSRKIVFQLASVVSNWQLAGAHFVYAHETGHTSGAPDEYAASACAITDKAGFSNGANTNCENGGTASVDCLMRNNTKKLCPATPGFFGWNDANGDGILDPFDSTYSTSP
jgi:hypothetical protein